MRLYRAKGNLNNSFAIVVVPTVAITTTVAFTAP